MFFMKKNFSFLKIKSVATTMKREFTSLFLVCVRTSKTSLKKGLRSSKRKASLFISSFYSFPHKKLKMKTKKSSFEMESDKMLPSCCNTDEHRFVCFLFFYKPHLIRNKKERKGKRNINEHFKTNRNLQSKQFPLCVHISIAGWRGVGVCGGTASKFMCVCWRGGFRTEMDTRGSRSLPE